MTWASESVKEGGRIYYSTGYQYWYLTSQSKSDLSAIAGLAGGLEVGEGDWGEFE
jgi:hypothetical protein